MKCLLAPLALLVCLVAASPAQAIDNPEAQRLLDQIDVYNQMRPSAEQVAEIKRQYAALDSCLSKLNKSKVIKKKLKKKSNKKIWAGFKRVLSYYFKETVNYKVQKDNLIAEADGFRALNFDDITLDGAAFYGADSIDLRVEMIGLRDFDACKSAQKFAKQKRWSNKQAINFLDRLLVPQNPTARARTQEIINQLQANVEEMDAVSKHLDNLGASSEELETFYIFAGGLKNNFIVK